MILASALKFRFKGKKKYVVLCACRHGDIYQQILDLGYKLSDITNEVEGFINHKNKFLTRPQAFEHAKKCGQLSEKIIYDREHGGCGGKNLISEDLW